MAPIVFRGVPVKRLVTCRLGHVLTPCATPLTKAKGEEYKVWACDLCQRAFDIARSEIPMHCAECEYDICDACFRPPATTVTSPIDVPLEGVTYSADVIDFVARVELRQLYHNTSPHTLECVYEFPIDTRAAVCAFRCELPDGRVVVGEAREIGEAREAYAAAAARGDGAYLGERTTAGTFRMKVGNLPAGGKCAVVLTYSTTLSPETVGGPPADAAAAATAATEWALTIPTTLVPKYTPPGTRPDGGVEVVVARGGGYASRVVAQFHASDAAVGVGEVACRTHPAAEIARVGPALVEVRLDDARMDRDVVLSVRPPPPPPAAAGAAGGEGAPELRPMLAVAGGEAEAAEREWAVAVPVVARFSRDEAEEPAAEFVFVVDCSGSMAGAPMLECARTLRLLVQSLPVTTRATVVRFGSRADFPLGDEAAAPAPLDATHRARMLAVAAALKADLGGTELLAPLKAVYSRVQTRGVARQVFVLTDGGVGNTAEVTRLAAAHAGSARTFAVGVGGAADHALCDGLAAAGGGTAIYVAVGAAEIAGAVMGQVGLALRPALADVRVHFSHPRVRLAGSVPPIFLGRPALLFGSAPAGVDPAGVTMTITAAAGRREVEVVVPLGGVRRVGGSLAAAVLVAAAAAACRGEEGAASFGTDAAAKARVVAAATRWGLATSQTAFVAVEERADPATGGMVRVGVPLHAPATYQAAAAVQDGVAAHEMNLQRSLMRCVARAESIECLSAQSERLSEGAACFRRSSRSLSKGGGGGIFAAIGHGIAAAASAILPTRARAPRPASPPFAPASAADKASPPPPPAGDAKAGKLVAEAGAAAAGGGGGGGGGGIGVDAILAALGDDGLWHAATAREVLGVPSLPAPPAGVGDAAWATALVLAALDARHAATRAEWGLAVRRAATALRRACGGDSDAVMAAARAAV